MQSFPFFCLSRFRLGRRIVLLLFFTLVHVGIANATLLMNPSFEDPDIPNTGYTDVNPSGWVSVEPTVFQVSLFDRPDFPAEDGDQFLAFNAAATPPGASIHQTFSTIQFATYEVSFWATANVPSFSSVNASVTEGVGLGGSLLASQNSILGGAFDFTKTSFSFVAASTTSTLAFLDNSPRTTSSDLFLDHVEITLTEVPEPSGLMLFSLLACSFGAMVRCPCS